MIAVSAAFTLQPLTWFPPNFHKKKGAGCMLAETVQRTLQTLPTVPGRTEAYTPEHTGSEQTSGKN